MDEPQLSDSLPAAMFQGYDSFKSAGRSTAVEGKTASAGIKSQLYYTVCSDTSSLQQSLNISASASASYGFGSVDAKSDFVQKLNVTNTSVTVVVYTDKVVSHDVQTDVSLKINPGDNMNDFFRSYGDSYLSELVTGAEYMASYVFYSETIEQQQQVTATLAANGISAGGSVSASLQTSLEQAYSQTSMRKTVRQLMTGVDASYPPEDQIINFALNFNSLPVDAPVIVSYQVTGYERVPEMPDFSSIVATRTLFEGAGQQDGLSDQYVQLRAIENAIDALRNVYQTYGYTGDTTLTDREAVIVDNVEKLDLLFNEMDLDPTKTYTAPVLDGLTWGTPSLTVILHTNGPYGGNGGSFFQQVNEGSVSQSSHLIELRARGGHHLDQIEYAYRSSQGDARYVEGGTGGSASNVLYLQADERVTSIWGKYGDYVNIINVKTSFGNTWYWPPSPEDTDKSYSWNAAEGKAFLGFAGRSGKYVDQLDIIEAVFNAAKWRPYNLGTDSPER